MKLIFLPLFFFSISLSQSLFFSEYAEGTSNNKYQKRIMLPLSLSYDHRVIDGAEGARFCVHLKESLGKDFAYKLAV